SPRRRSPSAARVLVTACSTPSPPRGNPNLVSDWPVRMWACPPAPTPGATRNQTSAGVPLVAVSVASRSSSSKLSMTNRPIRCWCVECGTAVDASPSDLQLERTAQLLLRLVVPVQHDPVSWHLCPHRGLPLPFAGDVDMQALGCSDLQHGGDAQRLAGVLDVD